MRYGILVTKKGIDIFSDGSKKITSTNQGWRSDSVYSSMKDAKKALTDSADMLNEDAYDVKWINSVTLTGTQKSYYNDADFAPSEHLVEVVYHIEKR